MRKDWDYKKLGEVCITGAGGTPLKSNKEYYIDGTIPWIRSGEVNNKNILDSEIKITQEGLNNSSAKLFPAKTVVIAMYGATAGQVGILNFECATNQAVCGILPNEDFIPEFLYYYFLKFKNELIAQAVGNAQPNISQAKIRNTIIPIISLEEQKQIVKLLDQAFEAIDQAKANIEKNIVNAKELFQSKLNQVFSQVGGGWEEKLLPDLVSKSCTLSYGVVQPGDEYENGLPIVRPTDLKNTYVNLDNLKRIDPDKSKSYSKTILKGNELLLCVRGDTGVVSLITDELNGANVTRGIVPILFDENLVRVKFGYFQFISELIQKQIKAKTYGAALMQINIRDVRQLKLNIPSIEVQDKLLPILDEVLNKTELLLHSYTNKLTSLEELKRSILQKAFSGELTK